MDKQSKITFSLLIATGGTVTKVIHNKVGGFYRPEDYSEKHTWGEILSLTPSYILLFLLLLLGSLAYFFILNKQTDAICPKCGECFVTSNLKAATCQKCGSKAEKLEGFYERHPETK